MTFEVGQQLAGIEVGPIAHGGHFVARHEGRVLFVRGALSGELVDVRITEVNRRFARAEVSAVHRPSPHRVKPPCPVAGRCGGCDFQHIAPAHTRELKRQVVVELLDHLGGYHFDGEVEEVPPSPGGWRTRMRYHVGARGQLGLTAHRSREVVELPPQGCFLAVESIARPQVPAGVKPGQQVLAVAADSGTRVVAAAGASGVVTEKVDARQYQVAVDGFWQAHRGAAKVLTDAVIEGLHPQPGELVADLYCGVGLFAAALAERGCHVLGVEGDREATELARRNVVGADFLRGDVGLLVDRLPRRIDLIVLDPPRTGAGAEVMRHLLERQPRAVGYVACDPAALGRDLGTAAQLGYRPTSVTAFDVFPLTHHVECVAILEPTA